MNFYGTLHGAFVNGLREILAHKMRSLLSMMSARRQESRFSLQILPESMDSTA